MTDIKSLLEARGKTHGDFFENSNIAQQLKQIVKASLDKDTPAYVIEGLDMICHKLARIAKGDYTEVDHWKDIAGYAILVQNLLANRTKPKEVLTVKTASKELSTLLDDTLKLASYKGLPKEERTIDHILSLLVGYVTEEDIRARLDSLGLFVDEDRVICSVFKSNQEE